MDDLVTGAGTEVRAEVDLPPEQVWALVTDVTRIGEWSPECVRAGWLTGDGRPPRVGDRFEARNEYPGGFTATVECVVTEAAAPSVFGWVVLDDARDPERPGSRWRYRLTATPEGTLVTHTFTHGPGLTGLREGVHTYPDRAADVIAGRLRQLHGNMTTTLRTMLEAR